MENKSIEKKVLNVLFSSLTIILFIIYLFYILGKDFYTIYPQSIF